MPQTLVRIGRPPIGPKVQAHVPDVVKDWIRKEMKRTGCRESEVVRELVVAGYIQLKRRGLR